MEKDKGIAERLKEIRREARMTQKEMAVIIGLTSGSVGALENAYYTPNFDVLRAIHNKLGVSYDYIIDGIELNDNASKLIEENARLKEELDRMRKIVDKLVK
jgi:transcriptional regulator with XRE-family HTH domain